MSTPRAIEHLGSIAAHLRDTDHPLAEWLTEVVAAVRLGGALEAALDLAHGYGAVCRQQVQDTALAALARAAPVNPTTNARANWIAGQAALYEVGAWKRDRESKHRPDGILGHLYDLLSSEASLSVRSLRRVLPLLANNNDVLANGPHA